MFNNEHREKRMTGRVREERGEQKGNGKEKNKQILIWWVT